MNLFQVIIFPQIKIQSFVKHASGSKNNFSLNLHFSTIYITIKLHSTIKQLIISTISLFISLFQFTILSCPKSMFTSHSNNKFPVPENITLNYFKFNCSQQSFHSHVHYFYEVVKLQLQCIIIL